MFFSLNWAPCLALKSAFKYFAPIAECAWVQLGLMGTHIRSAACCDVVRSYPVEGSIAHRVKVLRLICLPGRVTFGACRLWGTWRPLHYQSRDCEASWVHIICIPSAAGALNSGGFQAVFVSIEPNSAAEGIPIAVLVVGMESHSASHIRRVARILETLRHGHSWRGFNGSFEVRDKPGDRKSSSE